MDKEAVKRIIRINQDLIRSITLQPRGVVFEPAANYVVVGMRRAGKTYLLYQHIQKLLAEGHSIDEILYVNFEDERIFGCGVTELQTIIDAHSEMFEGVKPIVFLDEIQNVDGWEHFARRLADQKYRVFITGSNSHMLSREIASSLGGRFLTIEVYPFSFAEFVRYRGVELRSAWEYGPENALIVRLLDEYYRTGGLSEVFDIADKRGWLTSLFQRILLSDVILRRGVRNERQLRLMVRKLGESVMQPMAVRRMQNVLQSDGSKITRETLGNYWDYLHEAYITFSIPNYVDGIAASETVKKTYFYDNGILNLFLFQPEPKLLENLIAIALYKRYGESLRYYNRNVEVDFAVAEASLLVQVCYDIELSDTRQREIRALSRVASFLNARHLFIVTLNSSEEVVADGDHKIHLLPAHKFLLSVLPKL